MTGIDVDLTHYRSTKLHFFELEGICDDELDQELAEQLGSTSSPETVLAAIANQLPDKLEFNPDILEEGPTYTNLLTLIAEATASKNFCKLRRLGLLRRRDFQSVEIGEEEIHVRKLEAVNLSAPTDSTGLHFVKLEGIDDTKLDQDIMQMLRYSDLEAMKPMGLITLILLHVAASFPEHLKFQRLLIPKDGTLFEELHLLAQEAVKTGQYHQIRRLGLLQKPNDPAPGRRSHKPSIRHVPSADAQEAWKTRYQGNHPLSLFNSICNMKNDENPYGNQVAVIQSSGTGKSRMVDELAKLVFTIPFNLGLDQEAAKGAFPAPDRGIRDYLLSAPYTTDFHAKMHHMIFLGAIFKVIKDELEKSINVYDRDSLAKWWHSHLAEPGARTRVYSQIITEARETKYVGPAEPLLPLEQYNKHTKLLESFGKKVKSMIGEENVVDVVIYFDEAHTLLTEKCEDEAKGPGWSSYDNLCWAATFCCEFPIFFIFLSTGSGLPQFSLTKRKADKADLNTPIHEMPFDCHPQKVQKGKRSMDETASIPFMAKFGRPLFWTILDSSADGGDISKSKLDTVMELAKMKLLHSPSTEQLSEAAKLAAIDNAITLNYEPLRTWSHAHQDPLVANHARIVFSIPKHREYMRTGYLSEPLLAEAANRLLYEQESTSPSFCIDTLSKCDENGMLAKGHIRETIARSIMSNAYRRAVAKETASGPLNFSAGCSLKAFIEEVFAEEFADMILASKPDNVQRGQEFRTAFKNAAVRFTHFITMSTRGPKKNWAWTNIAWAAFVRSAAIICHATQSTIDFIIPILLQRDDKIDERVMSAILVQVKNRVQEGTTNEFPVDAEDVKLFPEKKPIRPYISLIMDLGIARRMPANNFKSRTAALTSAPPTPQEVSRYQSGVRQRHYNPHEHPRYQFIASGCSAVVYKNVDKAKFGGLLGACDIFTEHGRLDEGSIEAIKRLQPVWEPGIRCFDWIETMCF